MVAQVSKKLSLSGFRAKRPKLKFPVFTIEMGAMREREREREPCKDKYIFLWTFVGRREDSTHA